MLYSYRYRTISLYQNVKYHMQNMGNPRDEAIENNYYTDPCMHEQTYQYDNTVILLS